MISPRTVLVALTCLLSVSVAASPVAASNGDCAVSHLSKPTLRCRSGLIRLWIELHQTDRWTEGSVEGQADACDSYTGKRWSSPIGAYPEAAPRAPGSGDANIELAMLSGAKARYSWPFGWVGAWQQDVATHVFRLPEALFREPSRHQTFTLRLTKLHRNSLQSRRLRNPPYTRLSSVDYQCVAN